jgi:NTP pyrophosphatase (non-canonical NTP hydrolase)
MFNQSNTNPTPSPFVAAFNQMADEVHTTAREKGWWDTERNDGEILMLVVTELAEVCEALRVNNPPDDKIPEFSSAEVELSDVIIRAMDFAAARGWRVAEALEAKMAFNKTRAHKHGGKLF